MTLKNLNLQILLLFSYLMLLSQNLNAQKTQSYIVDSLYFYQDITTFCSLLAVSNGEDVSLEELKEGIYQNDFKPIVGGNLNLFPQSDYWLRISLNNQIPKSKLRTDARINFSDAPTDVRAFEFEKQEEKNRGRFSAWRKNGQESVAEVGIPISLPAQQISVHYFRIKNDFRSQEISTKVYFGFVQEADFQWISNVNLKNGVFMGFVLMMFIYSIWLYYFFKDKIYLNYAVYLSSILLYTAFTYGLLRVWVEDFVPIDYHKCITLFRFTSYLIVCSYLLFLKKFVNLKEIHSTWNRIFVGYINFGLVVLFIDGCLMFHENFSTYLSNIFIGLYIFGSIILTIIFSVFILKKRKKEHLFIIGGIYSMILGSIATVLKMMTGIFEESLVSNLEIGVAFDIVLFAIGLAYRSKEKEENQKATELALEKAHYQQELEKAENRRLTELNETRTQLYDNVTHEFRTPLTIIKGMTTQIEGNEEQKEMILRNSDNLLRLVTRMLDLAKLEGGKMTVHLKNGNIISYIQYLLESFGFYAQNKGVRLHFLKETEEIIMDFDEEKIKDLLSNLLSNAIKFTQKDGHIYLQIEEVLLGEQKQLKLVVKDTGIGISEEQIPYVFNRFHQTPFLDQKQDNQGYGTGIGLALCKELVNLLEGEIEVKSQLKIGTTFTVHLPLNNEIKREENKEIQELKALAILPKTPEKPCLLIKNETSNTSKDKPLLLLVDDNKDVLKVLKFYLYRQYDLLYASNGKEGLNLAKDRIPDLIISDVMMPEMSGFELCQKLKEENLTSHIPIILLTAKTSLNARLYSIDQGADAYLTKPFIQKELIGRIEQLLTVRKTLQNYYQSNFKTKEGDEKFWEKENEFLQKLRKIIEKNFENEDFDVLRLSRKIGLSRSQLYRKVNGLTGESVALFIRSVRLEKARELLLTSDFNVSEVALQVGFKDLSHFSRSFSEKYDVAPSRMRE